jgi:hypothetical protein
MLKRTFTINSEFKVINCEEEKYLRNEKKNENDKKTHITDTLRRKDETVRIFSFVPG